MTRYKAELRAIPSPYREHVRAFAEDGKIPTNQLILACCAGDFLNALKLAPDTEDLVAILTFLTNQVPPFAWGSALNMAKWEFIRKSMVAA
jgi:hypothetical protein